MSARLPEPQPVYSQTWASQSFRILERALSAITGLETSVASLPSTYQPLDATLTALAGANWAANALPIGTGADALSQTSFAANTFPARASTGNLVAKTITDFGLSLVDDADASAARTTLGLGTAALVADSSLVHIAGTETITGTKTFSAGATFGSDVIAAISGNDFQIRQNTANGADSKSIFIAGGGSASVARGAIIVAYGNEYSGAGGYIDLNAGDASGARVRLQVNGSNVAVAQAGAFDVTGAISATGKISSSVASGSNALQIASGARFYLDGGGDTYIHESSADVLAFVVGSGTRLTINATGAIYGTVLHNNATALTGTTNQYIGSGTWTPTITGVTNVASSTSASCQYIRVGNVVTCSGVVQIDPTAAAYTVFALSLPIASNFSAVANCGGSVGGLLNAEAGGVEADTTNDRAQCSITLLNSTNQNIAFHFTYVVL